MPIVTSRVILATRKTKNKSWAASNNDKSYKVAKCEDSKRQTAGRDQTLILSSPLREKDDGIRDENSEICCYGWYDQTKEIE